MNRMINLGYYEVDGTSIDTFDQLLQASYKLLLDFKQEESLLFPDMMKLLKCLNRKWQIVSVESAPGLVRTPEQINVRDVSEIQRTDVSGFMLTTSAITLQKQLPTDCRLFMLPISTKENDQKIPILKGTFVSGFDHKMITNRAGNTYPVLKASRMMPESMVDDVNSVLEQLDSFNPMLADFIRKNCSYVSVYDLNLGRSPSYLYKSVCGCINQHDIECEKI
jgi:hypothetical protein